MVPEILLKLAICPVCAGELSSKSGHLNCSGCKTKFPDLNGVPWLFAAPEAVWLDWRDRVQFQFEKMAAEVALLEQAKLQAEGPSALGRIKLLSEGLRHNANVLVDLMKPLLTTKKTMTVHEASRSQLGLTQELMGYYSNLHRDWCWGDAEFDAQDRQIQKVAGTVKAWGKTLVLGAGAGRFANDFAQSAEVVVALDINPLLVAFGARMSTGKSLDYYEFPIAPKNSSEVAKRQSCKAKNPAGERLVWLLADGLNPPFKDGAFDTVVTPWFIDIIPEEPSHLAAKINRLLKPGGHWLNFGPCSFLGFPWARQFPANEVLEIAEKSGFTVKGQGQEQIPYLNSPVGGQKREETVLTFLAEKSKEAAQAAPFRQFPEWLENLAQPIPLGTKFEHYQKIIQIQSEVLGEIDGKSSVRDIAKKFAPKYNLSEDDAASAVLKLLRRLLSGN